MSIENAQNTVINKLIEIGFARADIIKALKQYGIVFDCPVDINNIIEIIQQNNAKSIPELAVPEIIVKPKSIQEFRTDVVPLPEIVCNNKPKPVQNNKMDQDDDESTQDEEEGADDDESNEEDEQRQMDGIVQHNLGSAFSGEMLIRLRESKSMKNCAYYFYVNELIKRIHAPIICECISKLHVNENYEYDWKLVSKWIIDFISIPRNEITLMCSRINRVIEGKIIMSLLHPTVSSEYMIRSIHILKVTKCNDNNNQGFGNKIYIHTMTTIYIMCAIC